MNLPCPYCGFTGAHECIEHWSPEQLQAAVDSGPPVFNFIGDPLPISPEMSGLVAEVLVAIHQELLISDTDRLDAIENGCCVYKHELLDGQGWSAEWVAVYGCDQPVTDQTLRGALDKAIQGHK